MIKVPKFYYVYIITNTLTNKQYVGSRICYKDNPKDDDYWGSSRYLNEDYKICGKDKFLKEIINTQYKSKQEMLDAESFYIFKYNTLAPNGYNRFIPNKKNGFHSGGNIGYWKGKKQPQDLIIKRAKSNTGKKRTQETKDKTRNSLLGITFSNERKNNISNSLKGKHFAQNFGDTSGEKNGMWKYVSKDQINQIIELHTTNKRSPEKIYLDLDKKVPYHKILKTLRDKGVYKKIICRNA